MHSFPIDSLKDDILNSLEAVDFLIIKSTPGSGKTTRVPLFLKEKYKKKIYILEPRKLAAKLAAGFVASSIGEKPGESVGHIFKYEKKASDNTQIVFLTEGTFLRILASNPALSDCDVVILDEFHERHYYTDVALSFLLKVKEVNKNLKVVIMSATINLSELDQSLKEKSRTLELNERKHQLQIEHLPNNTLVLKESLERKVLNAVDTVTGGEGHILIFLSGMYEIKKCEEAITRQYSNQFEIVILHGEVGGVDINDEYYNLKNRKVILSTNVAESSVTIPGVRVVIDSGQHKTNRLNPVTRLPIVELKKISQSSAIQRANRASREADGLCLRLYAELDYQTRDQFDVPEINRVDLSELIMTSAEIFNCDISELKFLSPLKESEVDKAKNYLEQIGLLKNGRVDSLGKKLAKFPFHPRISKIMDEASKSNELSFNHLLHYLAELVEPKGAFRFKNIVKNFFKASSQGGDVDLEKLMLYGYVDQLGKMKNKELIHMNGETYGISPKIVDDVDPHHALWIILDLDNRNQVIKMLPIEEDWLYDLPFFPVEEVEKVDFSLENFKLSIERIARIGAIVLSKEKVSLTQYSDDVLAQVARKLSPHFK